MLQQPLRLGGLALVCALATSVLVLVTFLASNLVLSVLGGLGGLESAAPDAPEPPVAVLLSSETDEAERSAEQRCRSLDEAGVRGPTGLLARCDGRRPGGGAPRP